MSADGKKPADYDSPLPSHSFRGVLGGQGGLINKIKQFKEDFKVARDASVQARLEANRKSVESHVSELWKLASSNENSSGGMLSARMRNPPILIDGLGHVSGEGDLVSVNLPYLEKLPRYNTWTFLAKNQMMPEEESVIGKKIIYYRDGGTETDFCSDSEEEEQAAEPEEQRHEFTEEEDHILWMTYIECGIDGDVLEILKQFVGGSISEIQERCNLLRARNLGLKSHVNDTEWTSFLGKRLSEAMDSLDNLFCRRCLVFDCQLHGFSQGVINSIEKRPYSPGSDDEETPCGDHCYLLAAGKDPKGLTASLSEEGSSSVNKRSSTNSDKPDNNHETTGNHTIFLCLPDISKDLKPLEQDLLIKGIEIFGRNSCLIARNLLSGLRTCKEVFSYLNQATTIPDDTSQVSEMPARARKRGRARNIRFFSKSTGHPPAFRRNMEDKNSVPCKQYTPCGCQPLCGQDCPCLLRGTCCEKYCRCFKSCRNLFRGCLCAKSQCRSRQCPCFASRRECDPDVCRNCWVSCGSDPSLGEPSRRGEGRCGNMHILTQQRKKILLGRSDVSGWGAFTKDPVMKNDYLGEYTGEVMSHREADKRGKVYDRANSSYLFNLNDEYVLDANRKGNKLKFVNHSANPNCYAKVMFVGGDHRVGINASKNIEAGQEMLCDYQYLPGCAPPWAQKPDTGGCHHEGRKKPRRMSS